MDTIKAANRFTDYCQKVYDSVSSTEFIINTRIAQTYSKAIKDICGGQVWLEIVEYVEDVMKSKDIPHSVGIPVTFKNEKTVEHA